MLIRKNYSRKDLEMVIRMHGEEYESEFSWNRSFENYVRDSLKVLDAVDHPHVLWIAETSGEFSGCAGVVIHRDQSAQFRWLLVARKFRKRKLGALLLQMAIDYSRHCGVKKIFLWTVEELHAASRLYLSFGFRPEEQKVSAGWGHEVKERKYSMDL